VAARKERKGRKSAHKWQVIYKGKIEEFSPGISQDYWTTRSDEEKFAEVQILIKQAQAIKETPESDGSKFLRTTAVLKRL